MGTAFNPPLLRTTSWFFSCYFGFDRVPLYSPRRPGIPSAGSAGNDYCATMTGLYISRSQSNSKVPSSSSPWNSGILALSQDIQDS